MVIDSGGRASLPDRVVSLRLERRVPRVVSLGPKCKWAIPWRHPVIPVFTSQNNINNMSSFVVFICRFRTAAVNEVVERRS